MKLPLLSTLLVLSAHSLLPAQAQDPFAAGAQQNPQPAAAAPADPFGGASGDPFATDKKPVPRLERVQFDGASLEEVIDYLTAKAQENGVPPLNVIVDASASPVKLPRLMLQNVTISDVLKVVARVAGLDLEPVESMDSGDVVAWILRGPAPSASGMPGVGAPDPRQRVQVSAAALREIASVARWSEPAPTSPPTVTTRVIGIAQIFRSTPDRDQRMMREIDLAESLTRIAEDQKRPCRVKAYSGLDLLLLEGTPEGVAFVVEAVEALKENEAAEASAAKQP